MSQKADLPDYLAAERTFLAWIRTGLPLMGFGFVVGRHPKRWYKDASAFTSSASGMTSPLTKRVRFRKPIGRRIPQPTHYLAVCSGSHLNRIAEILEGFARGHLDTLSKAFYGNFPGACHEVGKPRLPAGKQMEYVLENGLTEAVSKNSLLSD